MKTKCPNIKYRKVPASLSSTKHNYSCRQHKRCRTSCTHTHTQFNTSYIFKEKYPVQISISEFRSNKDRITLKIPKCLLFAALGSFLYVVLGLIQPHTWPQDLSERVQITSWLLRDSRSFSQCRSNFSMEIKK